MRVLSCALALGAAVALGGPAIASPIFSPQHKLVDQATSLIVRGDYRAAEPLLRKSLQIDDSEPFAHYNLGVVLRETGRANDAIAEFQRADQLFAPDDQANRAAALYGCALAAEQQGDPAVAARAWNDYIRFDQRFASSQQAVSIARDHLRYERDLAQTRPTIPGTQKAGR